MRRKRCFAALSMTVMLAAICSCSVKEDRSDCPCWITVRAEHTTSLSAWCDSQKILDNHYGGLVDHTVPRGIVDLVASEGKFTVSEGQQMSELFAQIQHLDTDGEFATAHVELNKQFATITLDFKNEEDGRMEYDLLVRGNVCGADAHTLAPMTGTFRCIPEPASGRGYTFRVPRQKDNTLIAEILQDDDVIRTIPVGELIEKAHFDWTAPSLGDITILADLPANAFTITVKEWEGPVSFEVTI